MRNTGPLRKVVLRVSRHTGTRMSKRSGTIMITNHYESVFHLECGHRITGSTCAPDSTNKRCKKCSVQS